MNRRIHSVRGLILTATIGLFAMVLSGCSGDDGAAGAPGKDAVVAPSEATALNIQVTGASVGSPPVVNFKVTNQNGVGVAGFLPTDLRFNIAKLIPGTPSKWQNYIYRATGGVYGDQERFASSGRVYGNLVDNGDGSYTYTFHTDITKAVNNSDDTAPNCPAPCTDADGNALDLSYQPGYLHRIGVQMGNSAYPYVNATYEFVPNGGMAGGRDIVATAKCNECHNQLRIHGSRIETKLCVTCHNPGSWVAGTPNTPVDFKVMVHKIHRGEELPSVVAGYPYKIGNADFSDVVFPDMTIALGDTRNCVKCHDGTDYPTAPNSTAQGDNWKNNPSAAACGACHDDIYFGSAPPDLVNMPWQNVPHPGGARTDAECAGCHSVAGDISVAEVHSLPGKKSDEVKRYQMAIETFTAPVNGTTPVSLKFSVKRDGGYIDVTDGGVAPEFASANGGSFTLLIATNNVGAINGTPRKDFNNNGSGASTTSPAQPIRVTLGIDTATPNVVSSTCGTAPNTFTCAQVNLTNLLPTTATGIARAGIYGTVLKDITVGNKPAVSTSINIKSAIKDYKISGTPTTRRTVVDVAKCDNCHGQLNFHGGARADEPGLCVMCHNPDATDIGRRNAVLTGETGETGIDFKRLIHAIHGSSIRTIPLIVWGYPGAGVSQGGLDCTAAPWTACRHDFSDVRFPGIISDCATCHTGTTYALGGDWDMPTQSGILASTASILGDVLVSDPSITDPADDRNISPAAAVCTSCHDSDTAILHMNTVATPLFTATQATIDGNIEQCSTCHGPGKVADVKVVHGVK
jgi:OmcA/MtrC family decaheme c-type cytochrome